MEQPDALTDLFTRYLNNECTPAEVRLILYYFESDSILQENLRGFLESGGAVSMNTGPMNMDPMTVDPAWEAPLQEAYAHIREKIHPTIKEHTIRQGMRRWLSIAAVFVLLVVSAAVCLVLNIRSGRAHGGEGKDIFPGTYRATLRLSDGSVIPLDSARNGLLTRQGSLRIVKPSNGCLTYDAPAGGGNAAIGDGRAPAYNTISTPKGGEYRVVLPDGSAVWLNACSSLTFPVAFGRLAHGVTLKGEGYFEIAPHPNRPFEVHINDMTIQVLGTHFNVMAYPDEGVVRTTLLEGGVRVRSGTSSRLLRPGQQAVLDGHTGAVQVSEADLDEAVAWKNGFFQFHDDDIETVMRRIARWYDVEVSYEGKIPSGDFSGTVSRNMRLSQVLRILELSDVHVKMEGKKITVMP